MNTKLPIYLAPLQGFTNVFYRRAFHKVCGGVHKYFTPFFEEGKTTYTDPQLMPELDNHLNSGMILVPQVATNEGVFLVRFAQTIIEQGYQELNINMGCPFPMLVKRKKGGGLLSEPELIEKMLTFFFEQQLPVKLSVKMRSGLTNVEEGIKVIQVLKKFPLEELIIHPRLVVQKYNGKPDWDVFSLLVGQYSSPVVANGDIGTTNDIDYICERYSDTKAFMLGRGLLAHPLLLKTGFSFEQQRAMFKQFHEEYFKLVQENSLNWNQAFNFLTNFWYYPLNISVEGKRYYRRLKKHNIPELYLSWLDKVWDYL